MIALGLNLWPNIKDHIVVPELRSQMLYERLHKDTASGREDGRVIWVQTFNPSASTVASVIDARIEVTWNGFEGHKSGALLWNADPIDGEPHSVEPRKAIDVGYAFLPPEARLVTTAKGERTDQADFIALMNLWPGNNSHILNDPEAFHKDMRDLNTAELKCTLYVGASDTSYNNPIFIFSCGIIMNELRSVVQYLETKASPAPKSGSDNSVGDQGLQERAGGDTRK